MKTYSRRISRFLFLLSLVFWAYCLGFVSCETQVFPYDNVMLAYSGLQEGLVLVGLKDWFATPNARYPNRPRIARSPRAEDGLNLVTCIRENGATAFLMDMDGRCLQRWETDWFAVFGGGSENGGDADTADWLPQPPLTRKQMHLHGAVLAPDGDLIFNFEFMGLVRLNRDSRVVWKLPYRTHHSIYQDHDGYLWVCGARQQDEFLEIYPHRIPPYDEYTILRVSPSGEIVSEWSVGKLLLENGYPGLLYCGSLVNSHTDVKGDLLHLNDVEPFPHDMEPGFFRHGDVMVSLRNINTVFVFDSKTDRIRYLSTGRFIRQHDPDFVDGDTFSVFDNRNAGTRKAGLSSRIAVVKPATGEMTTYFEATPDQPFFTNIMGKHQWLENGNLLISETMAGRAFEITPNREIVWEFTNFLDDESRVGIVEEVLRIPNSYRGLFDSKAGHKETTEP